MTKPRAITAACAAPLVPVAAAALGLVPLVLFALRQGGGFSGQAYVWRVLVFTLEQAALSTALSLLIAVPAARALARRSFAGRGLLLGLLAVPLALPVIVGVFGLLAVFGSNGILGGTVPMYGLWGIVLAHVFFNAPLATRLLLEALQTSPPDAHRLAAQLGFGDGAVWRHVDWPALRPALPRVAALVFLLCAASFVIVLTLGGAAATTLEVAIYQSLRMDFNVSRALTLSAIQLVLSTLLVLAAGRLALGQGVAAPLRQGGDRFDGASLPARLMDGTALTLLAALVLPPLVAVAVAGAAHVSFAAITLRALGTSLLLATVAAALCLPLAWALAAAQVRDGACRRAAVVAALVGFIVPPAVMATGWFLLVQPWQGSRVLAVAMVAALNALMALPFATTVLAGPMAQRLVPQDRLAAHLGVTGITRFRLADVPQLRSAMAQAGLMAFVLSLGDLTAITLLGTQGLVTLPALVAQQMGHYRGADAGGTALLLAAICLALTLVLGKLGRRT